MERSSDETSETTTQWEVSTSVSTAYIDDAGVVVWTYRDGAVVELAQAKEEVGVIGSMVDQGLGIDSSGNIQGKRVPLLIDIRPIKFVSRDARGLLGSDEVSNRWCVSGLALVIKSKISRMIGNATLSWQRTKHPIRLFTDVDQAHEWLLQQPPVGSNEALVDASA